MPGTPAATMPVPTVLGMVAGHGHHMTHARRDVLVATRALVPLCCLIGLHEAHVNLVIPRRGPPRAHRPTNAHTTSAATTTKAAATITSSAGLRRWGWWGLKPMGPSIAGASAPVTVG